MKKKYIFLIIIGFFWTFFNASPAFADGGGGPMPNVVRDDAGLFTRVEILKLEEAMEPVSERAKATLMIVTSPEIDAEDPRYVVDRTLGDYIGNNENGVVFYIDMANRKFYISTSGNMIHYYTDKRISEAIDDIGKNALTKDNYAYGAQLFIYHTDKNVELGVPEGHYTIDEETGKITVYRSVDKTDIFLAMITGLFVVAFVLISVKSKYELKDPTYHYDLDAYTKLKLTTKEDILINSFITSRAKPKHEDSGRGSSDSGSTTHSSDGGSYGGGSGSF